MPRVRRATGCACWCADRVRGPIFTPMTRWSSATSATARRWSRRCGACVTWPTPPPTIGCGRPRPTRSSAPIWRGRRYVMEEALRAGVERIVYTSSVATLALRDDAPADETRPLPGEQGDRRLQEKQGHGRTAGRGDGGAARAAGRHRQSLDADRPARREADAHRPHHRRVRLRPDAGIRGYRPQSRACRRRGGGPSRGAAARRDRRALHSGRRKRPARHHARGHRRHCRPPSAEAAVSHCRALSRCARRRSYGRG